MSSNVFFNPPFWVSNSPCLVLNPPGSVLQLTLLGSQPTRFGLTTHPTRFSTHLAWFSNSPHQVLNPPFLVLQPAFFGFPSHPKTYVNLWEKSFRPTFFWFPNSPFLVLQLTFFGFPTRLVRFYNSPCLVLNPPGLVF